MRLLLQQGTWIEIVTGWTIGSDLIMSSSLALFGLGGVGDGASCGHGRGMLRDQPGEVAA